MKIILGSRSRSRKHILSEMGYKFEVMTADIDEKSIRHKDPEKLVLALANAKADYLVAKIKGSAILITSDQVVLFNGKILEKPENKDQARKFLTGYEKFPAKTITAVTVTNTATRKRLNGIDTATVWFHKIPKHTIDRMIEKGDVFSLAGGFSIEDPLLKKYIARIEGTSDSIMGLPKALTEKLIQEIES